MEYLALLQDYFLSMQKKLISTLKAEMWPHGKDKDIRPPSRVQLVFATIWRAFVAIDKKCAYLLCNSLVSEYKRKIRSSNTEAYCRNFRGMEMSKIIKTKNEGMEYLDFVDVLTLDVRDIVKDYMKLQYGGEEVKMMKKKKVFLKNKQRKAPSPGALFSNEMEVSSEIQVEADQLLDESPEIMNSRVLEIVLAEGKEIRILEGEGEGYMGNKSDDEVKINEKGKEEGLFDEWE
ncbi:hypothetical protein LguiB_006897 [Lonicera macranthoides]